MSKRTDRIAKAKARPTEETEKLRDAERIKPPRKVFFNNFPARLVGKDRVEFDK